MKDTPTLIGQNIAHLSFLTTSNKLTHFQEFLGKNLVLYFYPRDNTPGCTTESKDFAELYPQFLTLNTEILGVSRDSLKSHHQFKCKYTLPFELISDENEALCRYFKVLKEKNMYGIKRMGIERSTFLIDTQGVICKEWRNVKVPGHVAVVLEALGAN